MVRVTINANPWWYQDTAFYQIYEALINPLTFEYNLTETLETIKSKLWISVLSWNNTGDQFWDWVTITWAGTSIDPFVAVTSPALDEKVKYDAGDPTAWYFSDKIAAGTGVSIAEWTGPTENKSVITNSAPDQTVSIAAWTNITSVTWTYPNFTINATTQATGSNTGDETLTTIVSKLGPALQLLLFWNFWFTTGYEEYTYVAGIETQVDVRDTIAKWTKIFTINKTYTAWWLVSTQAIKDEVANKTLTINLTYNTDDTIATLSKAIT